MKSKLTKEKIFSRLLLAYFMTSPIFDLTFFYNRITTLIRILILLAFVVITFVMYPKCRKKIKYLLTFYLAMLGYLIISRFHAIGFNSNLVNLNYSFVSEAATLLKLSMPFTILFLLKWQNVTKDDFFKVVNVWVVFIAGSIVVTNLIGYSLSSYTNEITRFSILSWNGNLSVDEIATKGFFTYANQVSVILVTILPIIFYEFIHYKKRYIPCSILMVVIMLAMLMLGTRLSTYGGLLILIGLIIGYFGYCFVFKKKISSYVGISIVVAICWIAILPIAPCNSRMQEIESAKRSQNIGSMDSKKEGVGSANIVVDTSDENLKYIEDNINKATIGEQFYKEYYPYMYDMEFWNKVVEDQRKGVYIDYRKMEMMIAERLWEVDSRWSNFLFGISNSRMQGVTNIERDFVLQYYSFGVIGSGLCLSFYIYMLICLLKKILIKRSLWNLCLISSLGVYLLASYACGNSLNFLATSIPIAFLMGGIFEDEKNDLNREVST